MKTKYANILGGLAGAIALNVLHEVYRRFDDDAPRVDKLGEEAIEKGLDAVDIDAPEGNDMYLLNLTSDLVSNAMFYSSIGLGEKKGLLARGAIVGLSAGLGTLAVPKAVGLHQAPVLRTKKTSALTVLWYLTGGIVAAAAIKALRD